jgi:hypothetical protein
MPDAMPEFVAGIDLCQAFYHQAVRPVLERHAPGLAHAAALVGYGSDVLGYDTPVSRDHMWGPRLVLFLPPEGFDEHRAALHEALRHELPARFMGYSTHFGRPDAEGVRVQSEQEHGPVEHLVFFRTLEQFWQQELGISPGQPLTPADWLTFSQQQLLSVTAGRVYHDQIGLEEARRRFQWYPRDVWLYLLSAQWALIGQEEAFLGRTAQVGDELGARIVAARMVEKLMRLCFLMERSYAPYSKWFGTAFARLACAQRLQPLFAQVLAAGSYPEREPPLAEAYRLVAEMHNQLEVTAPVEAVLRTYSGWHLHFAGKQVTPEKDTRPFLVLYAPRFCEALRAAIHDPAVLALIPDLGGVNQFMVESSDALQSALFTRRLADDLVK